MVECKQFFSVSVENVESMARRRKKGELKHVRELTRDKMLFTIENEDYAMLRR